MSNYAVSLLTRMLEIYSPSGEEEELSVFLAPEMERLGFHVWTDDVGNVIGETGRGKPIILLCGHMDTVHGRIPIRVENNQLYGRGAVDAKTSLAAMIIASSTFIKRLPGKILVVGVVDEEGEGKGIKHFLESGISPDYAIFGEPSGVENITIGYKGRLHLKITCETQAGHSAAPWLFENAVEKAIEIWKVIQELHFPQEKLESRFYSITSCLTKIRGGKEASTVPSKCHLYMDLRIPPPLTSRQVFEEVSKRVMQYQAANLGVSVRVKIEDLIEPFEVDSSSLLVRALSWAIRKVRSSSPRLLRKTGTGDMNVLGNALKAPVVTYGPGDSHLDHTPNEHIGIQEYLDSVQVYREAVMKLLELHKKR
ncbi:MAG: M20/M25/M40 family metallo-hydrolase [Candidatus Bathyarchaeota archaeon]|nr:MAG: M20/M25/M40 family metallo-hydrolase [Candidatus Bathyarchaeota archaeon]